MTCPFRENPSLSKKVKECPYINKLIPEQTNNNTNSNNTTYNTMKSNRDEDKKVEEEVSSDEEINTGGCPVINKGNNCYNYNS